MNENELLQMTELIESFKYCKENAAAMVNWKDWEPGSSSKASKQLQCDPQNCGIGFKQFYFYYFIFVYFI